MSVAYILVAHKDPGQVARLVRRLSGPGAEILIHFDRGSPGSAREELESELEGEPGVRFLRARRIRWAHYSMLAATLDGLRAVEEGDFDPDQTVLITGQHYPIKPRAEIEARLSDRGVAYMQHEPLPKYDWWPTEHGGMDRFERVHVFLPRGRVEGIPLVRRRLPAGYRPYAGSAYWSLGPDHRRLVLEAAADRALMRCFRRSRAGDEVFFQTVLLSSELRDTIVNDSLVFTIWPPKATHPKLLGGGDLDAIAASPSLFARKFDAGVDAAVLDEIDRSLLRPGG